MHGLHLRQRVRIRIFLFVHDKMEAGFSTLNSSRCSEHPGKHWKTTVWKIYFSSTIVHANICHLGMPTHRAVKYFIPSLFSFSF